MTVALRPHELTEAERWRVTHLLVFFTTVVRHGQAGACHWSRNTGGKQLVQPFASESKSQRHSLPEEVKVCPCFLGH